MKSQSPVVKTPSPNRVGPGSLAAAAAGRVEIAASSAVTNAMQRPSDDARPMAGL